MSATTRFVVALFLIAGAVFTLVAFLPIRELATALIVHVRELGALGPSVYFFVYVLASVLSFSRTVLNIAAGILFDPVIAVTIVVLAGMAVFISTYSIARYFAADWVAARLKNDPMATSLMDAVENNGVRLLVLLRMNPFVPGFVNGYGFGLTSIRPLPYFAASVVGSLPLILIYVYLGFVGGEAMLRSGGQPSAVQTGTMIFGVILSLALLIVISWYGRKVLQESSAGKEECQD